LDLLGFTWIWSGTVARCGSMKVVKPASTVAFSREPNSKKPNVYAESVASFGNFHVLEATRLTPNIE
jgi:hypothetical protein